MCCVDFHHETIFHTRRYRAEGTIHAACLSHTMQTTSIIPQGIPLQGGAATPMSDPHALREFGWPPGLTTMVSQSINELPLRFVIVDNSGSMQSMDGTRLVPGPNGMVSLRCSRWQELGQAIEELGEIAVALRAPTHFHFLNSASGGQFFCIGDEFAPPDGLVARLNAPKSDLGALKRAVGGSPTGTTPLTEAVQRIDGMIRPHEQMLKAAGQKATVIISTDGKPNDSKSFLMALQQLQKLPVWLVVRLCTDEDDVVQYWSDLDNQLEAPLETLDDLKGEAQEVYAVNRWLTYAPALHMARMFGLKNRLFDLLDEKAFLPTQAKEFAELILACPNLPEPEIDPRGFKAVLTAALAQTPPVYNPVLNRMANWVNPDAITKLGKPGSDGCCVLM
jgi:hypothetical protein